MKFTLGGSALEIPEPQDLSNTEREILRGLAEPGGGLWKILRSMVDYGEGLKQALVAADFSDEAQMSQARKVQATIVACQWVTETFENALSHVDEPQERNHE